MDESELDKSETATPFKLQRAREKGTVARGLDLGFFAVLTALIGYAWMAGSEAAADLARASGAVLATAGNETASPAALMAQVNALVSTVAGPMLVFGGVVFAIVLAFEFLQVGPVFSAHVLKPDFNRINPAKGLKRLFSIRLLIESIKSVLKLAVYGTIAWLVVESAIDRESFAVTDGLQLVWALATVTFRLLLFCALAALAFAIGDQIWSRRDFAKKMRMSRRELKREFRDREGDPRFKQKRKERHGDFLKMAKSLRNVRDSDIILTNPTHVAVALRYDAATMEAPHVVARGSGNFAERIRRVGFLYGVTIVRDPALARALFRTRLLDAAIPDALYQPVADLYRAHDLGRRMAA